VEKRKPHFDLGRVKSVCGDLQRLKMSATAFASALRLGFDRDEVSAVIQSMQRAHFYKSMTSLYDHRRWQDVYHVPWNNMTLYVKFADDMVSEFVVLSFKER
jgi:motility quorum-sensing regulator/GCU-specific mRNA interferase toxin